MIKRLQIKFIAIVMGVLLLVFSVLIITLNVFLQSRNARQTQAILSVVAERDGLSFLYPRDDFPQNPFADMPSPPADPSQVFQAARIFCVKVDEKDQVLEVQNDLMFGFTEEDAVEYAESVLHTGKERGSFKDFQYMVADKEYGKIVVFVESSRENLILEQLIFISLVVFGITCIVLLGFAVIMARWVTKPVKNAMEKQKQFVSDASHELKTPLTIISANVDVLENEIGKNVRLAQIRDQSQRMAQLVHDLLSLAKTDEGRKLMVSQFDLSRAVLKTVLAFESKAFEEGKRYEYEVEENLHYVGDEGQIKQLVTILVDNAIKHSDRNGRVSIKLYRENDKRMLSVCNTGKGILEGDQSRIFERFYRSDASRSSKTGGYGLGLAIAKSIVDLHKGKISVESKRDEWTKFTVIL